MPSNLHLNFGASFGNKISSNEVNVNYVGVLQPKSRDVLFETNFGSNKNLSLNLMHRKRVIQKSNTNNSFNTDILEIQNRFKFIKPTISLTNTLQVRHDRSLPLYTSKESIEKLIVDKYQLSTSSELMQAKRFNKSYFTTSIRINPNLDLTNQTWNVSFGLDVNYIYKLNDIIRFKSQFRVVSSQGNSPNFFMIGGMSNDLLGRLANQTF